MITAEKVVMDRLEEWIDNRYSDLPPRNGGYNINMDLECDDEDVD